MADRSMRLQVILDAAQRFTAPFSQATKATTTLSQGLKTARDQVRALEATGRQLDGLQQLEQQIVDTAQELKKAKDAAAALERKFDDTAKPTKKLMTEALKAAQAVEKLEGVQRKEVERLEQVRGKLRAAGVETGDMARAQDRLRTEILDANRALEAQQKKLDEVAQRQKRFNRAGQMIAKGGSRAGAALAVGAAAGAGAAAIAVPVKAGYELGNEFESSMTDLGQKADLDRAKRAALAEKLMANARAVNQVPQEMVKAADTLAGLGMDVPVAVDLTKPIGKAATAYKADMGDLSAATFALYDNLKVPAKDIALAIDAMAFTGKAGAFEIKDMAAAMPSLTANYQALGQTGVKSAADLAAALQIVRKGAGSSEEAANNLENVLQKIGSPETERKFAKMGVNLRKEMDAAAKAGKTPIEAISEITQKALKGDLSKIGYLFEDAQVQKGLRPLIQNLEQLRTLRAQAMGAGGTVDKDWADRMQDGAAKAQALSNAMMEMKLSIASNLAPVLTPLVEKVGLAVRNFSAWMKEHPKLTEALAKGGLVVGAFVAAIAAIAFIVAPILAFIAALGAAAAFLGTTMGGVIVAILAVVGVVTAVVGVVIAAIKGWDKLAPIVGDIWNAIVQKFNLGLEMVKAMWSAFTDIGAHLMSGLAQGLANGLGKVKDAIFNAGSKVIGWFKEKLGIHSPSRVFAGLGGFVMSGLDQGLRDGQGRPLARVRTIAGELANQFQRAAPRLAANVAGVTALTATTLAAQGAIAAPSIRPGAAPPAATAPVINITINVQAAPGQDGQALGAAIGDHVQQAIGRALNPTRANAQYDDGYV